MPNIDDPDILKSEYVKLAKQHGENLHRLAADFKDATGKTLVVADPILVSNRDELESMMKVLTSAGTHQLAVDTEVMKTGKPGTIQISVADGPHAEKTFTVLVNAFRENPSEMSHLRSEIHRAFNREDSHQFYHNMAWDVGRLADDGFQIPLTNKKGEVTAHDTLALSRKMGSSAVGIKEDIGKDNSLVAVALRKLNQYTPKKLSGTDLGPGQSFDYMEEVSKSKDMNVWFLRYGATDALTLARLVGKFYKVDGTINGAGISVNGQISPEQLEQLERLNTKEHLRKLVHRPPPGLHTMLTEESRNTSRVQEIDGQLYAKSYIHDDDIDRGVLADIIDPKKIKERREQLEREELSKIGINVDSIPPEQLRVQLRQMSRENPQVRAALAKAMDIHQMDITPKLAERGVSLWSADQSLLTGTTSYNPIAGIRAAPKWVAREIAYKLGLFEGNRDSKGKLIPKVPSDFYSAIDLFQRGYSPMPQRYMERMKDMVGGSFNPDSVQNALSTSYEKVKRRPSIEETIAGFAPFGIAEETIRADPEMWTRDYHKYLIDNWMGISEISKWFPKKGASGFSSLREVVTTAMGRYRHTKSIVQGFTKSQAYAERDNALRTGEAREILMDLKMPSIYNIPGVESFRAKKAASVIKYAVSSADSEKIMDEKNVIMGLKDEYYKPEDILRYTRLGKFDNSDEAKIDRLRTLGYEEEEIEEMMKAGGPTLLQALQNPVLYDESVPWTESARIAVNDEVVEYAKKLYDRREGYSDPVRSMIENAVKFDEKGRMVLGQKDTRKIGRKGDIPLTTGWYQGTMSSDIAGLTTAKIFRDQAFLQNIPVFSKDIYNTKSLAGAKNYLEDSFDFFTQPDILKNIPNQKVAVQTAKRLIKTIQQEREYRQISGGKQVLSNAQILKLNQVFADVLNQRVLPGQKKLKMDLMNAGDRINTVPGEVEDITPGLEYGRTYYGEGEQDYSPVAVTGSTDMGRLRFKKGASQEQVARELERYEQGFKSIHDIFLEGKNIDEYTNFIDSLTAEAATFEGVDSTMIKGLKSVAKKMVTSNTSFTMQDMATDMLNMPIEEFYRKHIDPEMYAAIAENLNNTRGVPNDFRFRVMQSLTDGNRMLLTEDVFATNDREFIDNLIKAGSIPANYDKRTYTLDAEELNLPGFAIGGGDVDTPGGKVETIKPRMITMGQSFNQKVANAVLGMWGPDLKISAFEAMADRTTESKREALDEKSSLAGSWYVPVTAEKWVKSAPIGRISSGYAEPVESPYSSPDYKPETGLPFIENVHGTHSVVSDAIPGSKMRRGLRYSAGKRSRTKQRGLVNYEQVEKDYQVRFMDDIRTIVNQTTGFSDQMTGAKGPLMGTVSGVINKYLDVFGPSGLHEDIFGLNFTRYTDTPDSDDYKTLNKSERHVMAKAIEDMVLSRDDAVDILSDMRDATTGWWNSQGVRGKDPILTPNVKPTQSKQVPTDYEAPLGNSMYDWLTRADETTDIMKTFKKTNPAGARALAKMRNKVLEGMDVQGVVDWYKNTSKDGVSFYDVVDMVKAHNTYVKPAAYQVPKKVYTEYNIMKSLEGLEVGSDEYNSMVDKIERIQASGELDWDHIPGGMRTTVPGALRLRPDAIDDVTRDILMDMKEWKQSMTVPFAMPKGPAPLPPSYTTPTLQGLPEGGHTGTTASMISGIMAWSPALNIPTGEGIGEFKGLPNSKSYDFSNLISSPYAKSGEQGKAKYLKSNPTFGIRNFMDPGLRMFNILESNYNEAMERFKAIKTSTSPSGYRLSLPGREKGGFIKGPFVGAEKNKKETAWTTDGKLMGVLSNEGIYHAKDPAIILSNEDSKKVLPHFFGGTDQALEILSNLNEVDMRSRNRMINEFVERGAAASNIPSDVYAAMMDVNATERSHRATPANIRSQGGYGSRIAHALFGGFSRRHAGRNADRMSMYDPSGNIILRQMAERMQGTPEQMGELDFTNVPVPQGQQGRLTNQINQYQRYGANIRERTARQMQLYDIQQAGGQNVNRDMGNVYGGAINDVINRFTTSMNGIATNVQNAQTNAGNAGTRAINPDTEMAPLRRELTSMVESLRTMGADPHMIQQITDVIGQGGMLGGDIYSHNSQAQAVQQAFQELATTVSGLNPELRTMSGLVNIDNRAMARNNSPEYRRALMREGYIGNAPVRMWQNLTGRAFGGHGAWFGPNKILTNEESALEMHRRALARQDFGEKAVRFLKGRPERDIKDTVQLSFGGQFGKESAEGQALQAEIMAKAERWAQRNFESELGSGWRKVLKTQTGTVYDTSDSANKTSTTMSQLGISAEIDADIVRRKMGSIEAAERSFREEVLGEAGMTEKVGVAERQQYSVKQGQRSARISAENSSWLGTASTLQNQGRKMTALSMGAMGTYFSVTGMYSAINQGIRMVTDSLKDLSSSMKSIAITDSFSGGLLKSKEIMDSIGGSMGKAGVSQEDFVNGWKRVNALGSSFQVFLGSIAAKVLTSGNTFEQIADKLMKAFKDVDTGKIVVAIQNLMYAAVQLIPVFMDLIAGLAEFFGSLAKNKMLTQLIVQFTVLAFVLQPFLTIIATVIEGFALLFTIMGYGIPTMSLASKGMISVGTGTAFAANSVWALNGALMTSLAIAAVVLVAWQALGMALEHFANIKIPTPVSIGMGAFNMLTGGESDSLTPNCSGGPVKGYPDGGAVKKSSIGGFLKSLIAPGDNTLVSARDDEFIMNPRATRENLGLLSFLNLKSHATGGIVDGTANVFTPSTSTMSATNYKQDYKMGNLTDEVASGTNANKTTAKTLAAASGGSYLNVKMYGEENKWMGKGDEDRDTGGFNPLGWLPDLSTFVSDLATGFQNISIPSAVGAGAGGALVAPPVREALGKFPSLEDIWGKFKEVIGKIWEGFKESLGKIWSKLGLPDISNIWEGFKLKVAELWSKLGLPDLTGFWEGLKTKMMELITGKKVEKPNIDWIGREERIIDQWTKPDTSNEKPKTNKKWSYGDEYGIEKPAEKSGRTLKPGEMFEIGEDGKSKGGKGKAVEVPEGGFKTEKPVTLREGAKGGAKGGGIMGLILSGLDEMFVKEKGFAESLPTMAMSGGIGAILGAGMAVAPVIGGGVSMLGHDWMTEFSANMAGKLTGGKYNEETGRVEGGNKTAQDIAGMAGATFNDVSGWALTGATVGSVVPGVGTAIGALTGAGVGLTVGGIQDLFRIADEAKGKREAGDTGHLEGQYGLVGSGIAMAYNLGTDVREGRGIPGAIAGAGAATGEAITSGISVASESISNALTNAAANIAAFNEMLLSGAQQAGTALIGVGTTILEMVTSGLTGLADLGSMIRETILGMIKNIPIVGDAAATVVGAITNPVSTVKDIVGLANGGLMTKSGIVEAHAGEVIGPLSSISDIISNKAVSTLNTSGSVSSGGNTYSVSVPITINGNADDRVVKDLRRQLESLLPGLLKEYDMQSKGI